MSLRLRLLLAVGLVAGLALLAADAATYTALRTSLYHRVDQSLDTSSNGIEQILLSSGMPRDASVLGLAPGTTVEARDAAGNILAAPMVVREPGGRTDLPALPADIGGLSASPVGARSGAAVSFNVRSTDAGGPLFRVRASALPGGLQLIVATPLTDTIDTLHRLLAIELAVSAGALVIAAGLGWWLVRVGLAPLAEVKQTAAAIADGQLDRRVPGEDSDTEVGQVARALNVMLGRIEGAFAQRDATEARLRRFVADASHELRTPLAAVMAYSEMFQWGASERPADLARLLAGIQSQTTRMSQLVEDLLLLARLDEGRPLERRPVELVRLTAQAVETATAVGPEWPVRLRADRPVEVVGDEGRLRQVVDNLLANVRAHTPPGTNTQVRVAAEGDQAVIEVADNGPGLTDEQAGRVFERFYRADPSRSRQHGGSGLGLSIVAAIVAAHSGQVAVSEGSAGTGGSIFTVRLPAAPFAADSGAPAWAAGTGAVAQPGAVAGPAGAGGTQPPATASH